jgi:hypothetical protein
VTVRPHAHDTWTVLIIDPGAICYDLDTRHCGISGADHVADLPPGVVHDGRPEPNAPGFRKRNLYLDQTFLPEAGVSHAFLYNHPDLRARIEHLRAGPARTRPHPPRRTPRARSSWP